MKSPERGLGAVGLAALLLGAPAFGTASPKPDVGPRRTDTYGTSQVSYYTIDATAFTPTTNELQYACLDICQYRYRSNNPFAILAAPLHLPAGAFLTYIELDYYDTSTIGEEIVDLYSCDAQGQACDVIQTSCFNADTVCSGISNAIGVGNATADLTGWSVQIDNAHHRYFLTAENTTTDGTTAIGQVIIGYVLKVSAPPGTPTFTDVPTSHPFFQFIEALAASGVTGGCGGGKYCPDATLTRGQMAVFLAKALGLQWP